MDINVIQSADYVPGMSGYRLDLKAGAMEINSGHMAVGSLPGDPQMITVTASEWPESEVPAGAKARLAFLQEQIDKVPVEFRADAEFSTEDISFDRDGSDVRTTLTYRRLETDQEAAERVARQAGSGVTINADGVTIMADGKVVARIGHCIDDEQPAEQPFAVKGGQVFISQSLADSAMWSVNMQINAQGQYVVAGIGVGVSEAEQAKAKGYSELLKYLSSQITSRQLAKDLMAAIDSGEVELAAALADTGQMKLGYSRQIVSSAYIDPEQAKVLDPADQIRQVIRKELRPGGMLFRR